MCGSVNDVVDSVGVHTDGDEGLEDGDDDDDELDDDNEG